MSDITDPVTGKITGVVEENVVYDAATGRAIAYVQDGVVKSAITGSPIANADVGGGGSAEYYKCTAVDTANKTWTGYLAVLTDGVYAFEATATTGLTYGTAYTPKPDGIYNADATVQITNLWQGSTLDIGLVFDLPMTEIVSTALTGQALTFGSDITLKTYNGKTGYYMFSTDGITFPADDLSVEDYTIAISMARMHTDQLQTAIGYGSRSESTTALIGIINGDQLFFGGYNLEICGSPQTQGEWYHSVVVKSGTILTIYCNGVVDTAGNVTKSLVQGIGYIGRNSENGEKWHGYLADAKIWNRALTADEVLEVYNAANIPTA